MLYLKDNDFDSFKTTILDKNPFAMRLALQQCNKFMFSASTLQSAIRFALPQRNKFVFSASMVQSEADLEELFSKYNIIYDRYFNIEQQWIIVSIDDMTAFVESTDDLNNINFTEEDKQQFYKDKSKIHENSLLAQYIKEYNDKRKNYY